MAGAGGSEARWAFVAETTPGTTPASPSFLVSALDNVDIQGNPNTRVRNQNYADNRPSAIQRSGYNVQGSGSGGLIYGEYDAFLESLLQGAWTADVLKDGVSAVNAFSWEQMAPAGAGGTETYFRFLGVECTGGSITLTADEDAAVEFNWLGRTAQASSTSLLSGATYTDPTNTNVLGSGADVGTWTIDSLTIPCMRSATINFQVPGRDRQPQVGSDVLCGIRRGAVAPSIEAQFYVEAGHAAFYDQAFNGGEVAVTIPLGNVSGEKYTIEFPRCEFIQAPVQRQSADLFQNVQITPLYDTAEDCIVKITRGLS